MKMNPEIEELAITNPYSYEQIERAYNRVGKSVILTQQVLTLALEKAVSPDEIFLSAEFLGVQRWEL